MLTPEEKEQRKQARLGKNYIYPWIGVDLDKTLAVYDEFKGETHIGEPIPAMVERVFKWLAEGKVVKIFTARASEPDPTKRAAALNAIAEWSLKVFGTSLPVTCIKDYGCVEFYDDRAKQVIPNTGRLLEDVLDKLQREAVIGE